MSERHVIGIDYGHESVAVTEVFRVRDDGTIERVETRIGSAGNFMCLARARWPKRAARRVRMARKKRRGWA